MNVAYDVPETRRIWTTRALAVGLTSLVGLLLITALGVLVVGPKFGGWLAKGSPFERITGFPLKSYVSASFTYYFRRR